MHSTSALVRTNIYRVPYVLDTAAGAFSMSLLGRGPEGAMTQEDLYSCRTCCLQPRTLPGRPQLHPPTHPRESEPHLRGYHPGGSITAEALKDDTLLLQLSQLRLMSPAYAMLGVASSVPPGRDVVYSSQWDGEISEVFVFPLWPSAPQFVDIPFFFQST